MDVGRICHRSVATIAPGASLLEAARLMRDRNVGDVVVVDHRGGKTFPTGVLTDRDIVVRGLAVDPADLGRLTVADLVTDPVITIAEGKELTDAIDVMHRSGIRRIPVVAPSGALVGIITLDDVLGAMSDDLSKVALLVASQRLREAQKTEP
jgi:CBS domain-containing protein